MRKIITAAAQMGAIQKNEPRDQVVERMLVLLEEAKRESVDFVVYPELTLTTFFPRYFMEDQSEIDFWFEKEMPNEATKPLFKKSKEYGIAISFGYAELTEEGKHFNSSVIVDKRGEIIGISLGGFIIILQNVFGLIPLPSDIYFINTLPMKLTVWNLIIIPSISCVIILLSSYIASKKASSIEPKLALTWNK